MLHVTSMATLVCQMPADTVEMELKIKTTRGKYTLHKDTCMRTERYHPRTGWTRDQKSTLGEDSKKGGRVRNN